MSIGFTDKQKELLSESLAKENIKQREGSFGKMLDYIETHHAIREANRIFDQDWSCKTTRLTQLHAPMETGNGKWVTSYLASVVVTAGGCEREGSGYGNGIAKTPQDTYELAIKEAESDALKRALKNFGDPFGLALYDKDKVTKGGKVMAGSVDKDIKEQARKDWIESFKMQITDCDSVAGLNKLWLDSEKYFNRITPEQLKELEAVKAETSTILKEHS